jgi:hypothetical protein
MTSTQYLQMAFGSASGAAAIVAALFWRAAARYPVAKFAPSVYGDTSEELKPLNEKIQRGADLNAKAATWAAIAAALQGMALLTPLASVLVSSSAKVRPGPGEPARTFDG